MRQLRPALFALIVVLASSSCFAQAAPAVATSEQRTARYLDSIRSNPELLDAFLREMPKGADLHNHLSGAVYAESYIRWGAQDGLCVDTKTMSYVAAPCDEAAGKVPAANALKDSVLYRNLIDALSMRHFSGALQSGHDHFFDTFGKFGAVSRNHIVPMFAEAVSRAGSQHVEYIEMIWNPERGQAESLGAKLGWHENFDEFRKLVDDNGAAQIVAASRSFLDDTESQYRQQLGCPNYPNNPGCATTLRHVYEIYRGLPKEMVFAQMQIGFELAAADPRVVSINPVMPEDAFVPMNDFSLHMRMFDYFHRLYPQVKLTMHAGELAPGLVPPSGLRHHIRDSILLGHAERIGHGVDVMQEDKPFELLKMMRDRNIMVEINLTSNDQILGVTGMRHPLPVYMKYGVPVALSTDDEGVARSDITREYMRAVQGYNLSYADLKKMARTGIEHGFIDGPSLWADGRGFTRAVTACVNDRLGQPKPSAPCQKFLDGSAKAVVQWKLEADFRDFEEHAAQ